MYSPVASCRTYPARSISLWLIASASDGISLIVGISILEKFIVIDYTILSHSKTTLEDTSVVSLTALYIVIANPSPSLGMTSYFCDRTLSLFLLCITWVLILGW